MPLWWNLAYTAVLETATGRFGGSTPSKGTRGPVRIETRVAG